ncbi:hypothetical protein ElyMa_004660300, partial [Elysia marginata]
MNCVRQNNNSKPFLYLAGSDAHQTLTMASMENASMIDTSIAPTTPYFIDFLDEKKRRIIEILMDYIVIFSISVMGVVTNLLVIIVYA